MFVDYLFVDDGDVSFEDVYEGDECLFVSFCLVEKYGLVFVEFFEEVWWCVEGEVF